jgi:cupin superfamily acireductone dioxygenase involved in methionine salvage
MKPRNGSIDKKQLTPEEQFFSNEMVSEPDETSTMISDDNTNQSIVSKLQQQIDQLQQEKESLEIDNVCLKQQNHELKNRIDDVATHFPKASILLGKKPEDTKRKTGLKIKLKKRK